MALSFVYYLQNLRGGGVRGGGASPNIPFSARIGGEAADAGRKEGSWWDAVLPTIPAGGDFRRYVGVRGWYFSNDRTSHV